MKTTNVLLPLSLAASLVSGGVSAAELVGGTINFSGSVINAACSISPTTTDQSVQLGAIAINDLIDSDKKSMATDFSIQLNNCVLGEDADNTVTVTFNGQPSKFNPEILGTSGSASGVGVAIAERNSADNYLPLGTESSKTNLVDGNNTLHYSAYLVGDATPTEGDFTATTTFMLTYQ